MKFLILLLLGVSFNSEAASLAAFARVPIPATGIWNRTGPTTTNGVAYYVYTPTTYSARLSYRLVMYMHGAGGTGSDMEGLQKPILTNLIKQGCIVVGTDGGGTMTWGNSTNLAANSNVFTTITNTYPVSEYYLWGTSMGGLSAISLLANHPAFNKAICVYPVCNLSNMFWTTLLFSNEVKAAYSVTDPPTQGDFNTKTDPYSPTRFGANALAGKKIYITASYSDTVVSRAQNSDYFSNNCAAAMAQFILIESQGQHGDLSGITNIPFAQFLLAP